LFPLGHDLCVVYGVWCAGTSTMETCATSAYLLARGAAYRLWIINFAM
jgi:hypothetical protein